jgi:NitT/TauT family transport system ATP-binding protein
MSLALRIERVSKRYSKSDEDGLDALVDVSLKVPAGSFTSIIGPSGCGKSTLLRVLAGLTSATEGTAWVGTRCVSGPSREVGFVFQESALYPWRNVLSNVGFGLELQGVRRADRNAKAREFIKLVGLEGFESALPGELSGGMQQRAAIARALAMEPPVLFMDEPFGALDEQTRLILGGEVLRIWEATGTTIVLVTHSIQEAVLLSDQVVVLTQRPGRVKSIHTIDIPRPRDDTSIATPEFQQTQAALWADLRDEARGVVDREASIPRLAGGHGALS